MLYMQLNQERRKGREKNHTPARDRTLEHYIVALSLASWWFCLANACAQGCNIRGWDRGIITQQWIFQVCIIIAMNL